MEECVFGHLSGSQGLFSQVAGGHLSSSQGLFGQVAVVMCYLAGAQVVCVIWSSSKWAFGHVSCGQGLFGQVAGSKWASVNWFTKTLGLSFCG